MAAHTLTQSRARGRQPDLTRKLRASNRAWARRVCFLIAGWLATPALGAAEWPVDFSRADGPVRPLHGVNLGPLCYRGMVDLSDYHRALSPPLTRLHDVTWVNYDAVDISTIFRDFQNDPGLPESYQFEATDDYIAAIVRVGSPILYRLGESIEHTPRKYRVHPPKDFAKWADICCAIIRHYNEGWAGGFRHNIRYWEIWNEPENQPASWTGTDDQYFQLYEVTAKAVKSRWPDLKVGGPSLGHTGEFKDGQFEPGVFLLRFLQHCRERQVPLDFFSWHRYAQDPSDFARRARALRQLLDSHGFRHTESHFNEWNYLPNDDWRPMMKEGQGLIREQWTAEMRGPRGAAFAAWALMSLQDAPVDMANYYTAEIQMFGLFNFNGVPQKTFRAFQAFRALLDTPRRVKTPPCIAGQLAVCAGLDPDNTRAAVLLSNFNTIGATPELLVHGLPWNVPTRFELFLVDARHDFDVARRGIIGTNGRLALPELNEPAVVLLKLSPAPAHSDRLNPSPTR
jgi:xylan 1,4-beta-xylosidase